jgi:hypothetical protein
MLKKLPKETLDISLGSAKPAIFAGLCEFLNIKNHPGYYSGKSGVSLEVKDTGKCDVKEVDMKPKLKVTILPTACKPQIDKD